MFPVSSRRGRGCQGSPNPALPATWGSPVGWQAGWVGAGLRPGRAAGWASHRVLCSSWYWQRLLRAPPRPGLAWQQQDCAWAGVAAAAHVFTQAAVLSRPRAPPDLGCWFPGQPELTSGRLREERGLKLQPARSVHPARLRPPSHGGLWSSTSRAHPGLSAGPCRGLVMSRLGRRTEPAGHLMSPPQQGLPCPVGMETPGL